MTTTCATCLEQRKTGDVVRLDVYGDSDHAGCLQTPMSTTAVTLMRTARGVRVSSHTQSTVSLSSVAKASVMESSSAQPMAQERDPCMQALT